MARGGLSNRLMHCSVGLANAFDKRREHSVKNSGGFDADGARIARVDK